MRNDVILSKMITYAETIQNYCAGLDHDGFLASHVIVDACVFNLSQIGELAGKVDDAFRAAHSEIRWSQIKGLRNLPGIGYTGTQDNLGGYGQSKSCYGSSLHNVF